LFCESLRNRETELERADEAPSSFHERPLFALASL
jgi:hypothetical protein